MLRIGIDTGGTYTDFCAVDAGRVHTWKVPSTPGDPGSALRRGLRELLEHVGGARDVEVVYGSTIATNALLERRGGRTALVTTAGFEDVLAIGRQARPSLYDLQVERAAPLVARRWRRGVHESIAPDGSVEQELARDEAEAVAEALARAGIESVAVCLLSSYANPRHERMLERALRARGLQVSSSFRLLPEFREYERTSTTVVNAYLLPRVGPALRALRQRAHVRRLSVLQSNGGRLSLQAAATEPVRLLLSGPVGGAVGAWESARRHGLRRAIGFDMGGTSTDVCLLLGGPPERLHENEVAGQPVRVPMLDIHTVGAGGGSIARCDAGGALQVGPESAGADPGPACLGRGSEPTVTDAHVVLERIRPDRYLGGRLALDPQRARAIVARLARRLQLDVQRTALGIIRVANATMEKALRVVSLERGHDPRELALLSFGGAGGLHAADLVRSLRMRGALVPAEASVLSALGMLYAHVERDYARTLLQRAPAGDLQRHFEPLLKQARRDLGREGVTRPRLLRRVDLRYVGQSHELTVPWGPHFEHDFHRLHATRFGFSAADEPVEIVTVRVRAIGDVSPPPPVRSGRAAARVPRFERVSMWLEGGARPRRREVRVVGAEALPRQVLHGPLLVLRDDTTIWVPADFDAQRRARGALWLEPRRSLRTEESA
ncbi:MAG: hydantoinase/oxoprolinase family protein [Candidatus Latescibacterota bacterium]|nr:MAG: hydantoinase/oxoprolinase family protein [Candidatus Latescibacterota bacterium]